MSLCLVAFVLSVTNKAIMLNSIMLSVLMPNVVMLDVVMLSLFILSVFMLNVVMLNVIMLNVIMLNIVMLNVVASILLVQCWKLEKFSNYAFYHAYFSLTPLAYLRFVWSTFKKLGILFCSQTYIIYFSLPLMLQQNKLECLFLANIY